MDARHILLCKHVLFVSLVVLRMDYASKSYPMETLKPAFEGTVLVSWFLVVVTQYSATRMQVPRDVMTQ